MKIISILTAVIFLYTSLFGQNETNSKSFIIHGQIANCGQHILYLSSKNEKGNRSYDTIYLEENGAFYLKSRTIRSARTASFIIPQMVSIDLLVAPGYTLVLNGDAMDRNSFLKSKKITGIGSKSNQYLFLLDSVLAARRDSVEWWNKHEKDLLVFIMNDQRLKDSLFHVIFSKQPPDDRYFGYFRRMVQLNTIFQKLYYLIVHVDDSTGYGYHKSIHFVRDHFKNDAVLDHLFKKEYLVSGDYLNLMLNEYPSYLRKLGYRKESLQSLRENEKYWIKVDENIAAIATIYRGKIKEIALNKALKNYLLNCRSFEELNNYKKVFPPYIALLSNKEDRDILDTLLISKGEELVQTQIGKPAPLFTAQDSSGKTYQLSDFKGKVIYLDLWGSWCSPCRELTPYFKTLYEKYKNDERIVCVSVAVFDKMENWKKAVIEDKPTWLQLIDNTETIKSSYVANSVPKFVLINKIGNIVSFDAPMPNSAEIIQVLDREIAK